MKGGKYFVLLTILFINLFTMIKMGLRVNFLSELLLIVLFLIASLIILYRVFNGMEKGVFTALIFLVAIINMFYIRHMYIVLPLINTGTPGKLLFGINMIGCVLGFLIGITSINKEEEIVEEEKEEVVEEKVEPKIEVVEEVEKPVEKKKNVKTDYSPGKFVASQKSTYYHAPKCDWAKKINKKNAVWLKSKAEAKKKGYKAHSCLKK